MQFVNLSKTSFFFGQRLLQWIDVLFFVCLIVVLFLGTEWREDESAVCVLKHSVNRNLCQEAVETCQRLRFEHRNYAQLEPACYATTIRQKLVRSVDWKQKSRMILLILNTLFLTRERERERERGREGGRERERERVHSDCE